MFQCSYGELNMVLRQTGSGLFNSRGMVRVCVYGFFILLWVCSNQSGVL